MNIINLKYDAKFDAAHRLLHYQGPCNNLHGHTWKVELEIMGEVDPKSGMLIDFQDIKKIIKDTIMSKLDHGAVLNFEDKTIWQNLQAMKLKIYTLPGEPTCENLAVMIFGMVGQEIMKIHDKTGKSIWLESVRVWESEHASAVYTAINAPDPPSRFIADSPEDFEITEAGEKENEDEKEELPEPSEA